MQEERIEAYIQKRLAELEGQKDLQEVILKGRLSFGVDADTYSNLPAWKELIERKKQMVKMIWLNAFFVTLTVVVFAGDFFEKFEQNWIKALLSLIVLSAMMMLFYVVGSFYSVFYYFRKTEREVRKLIYQDILFQLKKAEKELV